MTDTNGHQNERDPRTGEVMQHNVERRADHQLIGPGRSPGLMVVTIPAGRVGASDEALDLDRRSRELLARYNQRREWERIPALKTQTERRLKVIEQERRSLDEEEKQLTERLDELAEMESREVPDPIREFEWQTAAVAALSESGWRPLDDKRRRDLERQA